nr:U6 snRNA phosphodiesterase [Leptinotarsa decemlineata]
MFKSNALSLLSIYGTDSSDDDDDAPGPSISMKRPRRDDDTNLPSKRLPRPDLLENTDGPIPEEHIDDPSLHDGRIRTFSHKRGNWPTFVYIPIEVTCEMEELRTEVMQGIPEHFNFKRSVDLHLSLTKTVELKHHWIEPFIGSLKRRNHCKKFNLVFDELQAYCNEECTRTFIGVSILHGHDSLVDLVNVLNQCLAEFNLPLFYDEPSFHMSIAWCLGDHKNVLNYILPELNFRLPNEGIANPRSWTVPVDYFVCKTGNKYFKFDLSDS